MGASSANARVVRLPVGRDEKRWLEWLQHNTDAGWRPLEWQHDVWLFTGSADEPTTAVSVCLVEACTVFTIGMRVCNYCDRARQQLPEWSEAVMPFDQFVATFVPRRRTPPLGWVTKPLCAIVRGGICCPRRSISRGLCAFHYNRWRDHGRPNWTVEDWVAGADVSIPDALMATCVVPACGRDTRSLATSVCEMHLRRYHRAGDRRPVAEWAATAPPYIGAHQFTLIDLDETLRWELLYAIQQRDARGARVEPQAIRRVIAQMRSTVSLSTMNEVETAEFLDAKNENNTNAHLAEFARYLRKGRDEMNGRSPMDRLVWDLVDAGISRDPAAIGGTRRRFGLDFTPITQPWLRELTLTWAREQTQPTTLASAVRATVAVSRALDQRRDHGNRYAALGAGEVGLVLDAVDRLTSLRDGADLTAGYKRELVSVFFAVIGWGRRNGHLDDLSPLFTLPRGRLFRVDSSADDSDTGKAIPVAIQRQLDANIDSIGRGLSVRGYSDDQAHLMFRTAYIVLRDTGRRPLEVASLTTDCLTSDASGPILIWNNHKSKRYGRRLPILRSTADTIQAWICVRETIDAPARGDGYLFPAAVARATGPHIQPEQLSRGIRLWVDGLDRLDTADLDDAGDPIPFDRTLVYPYAFRHSYAQRHADNGTPIDVLRDLMDHQSMQTTSVYYTITADRKRAAVQTVGTYTVDRHGRPDPLTDPTTYQARSTAVPFGNCIEPSNVKAGGQACPIRFQCAGCGFYRPDPSYIPAIEEHLASLRADREIALAMDAAPFVTDNLTSQIDAFATVLRTMGDQLDALDAAERERVELAATVLRRARAAVPLPLTVNRSEER